jgi:hypothetical protein
MAPLTKWMSEALTAFEPAPAQFRGTLCMVRH